MSEREIHREKYSERERKRNTARERERERDSDSSRDKVRVANGYTISNALDADELQEQKPKGNSNLSPSFEATDLPERPAPTLLGGGPDGSPGVI